MISFTKQTFKPAIAIPKSNSASAFSGRVLSFRSDFGSEPLKIHTGGRDFCYREYRLFLVDRSGGEMELVRKLSRGCFSDPPKNDQEVELEPVEGGEDVFDAAAADSKVQPEHLVIMVNGLIGSADDWRYTAKQFRGERMMSSQNGWIFWLKEGMIGRKNGTVTEGDTWP